MSVYVEYFDINRAFWQKWIASHLSNNSCQKSNT